jgi:hypothetical protein
MAIRGLGSAVLAAALSVVLCATLVTPAAAVDYPSWDDVEAARGDEAATAAAVAQIDSLLDGLQAEAARLGDAAVAASATAQAAQNELDRATAAATSLARRADAAADRSRESSQQAGQIAAALYRTGGTDLTGTLLLVSGETSTELLYQLGALGKVGGQLQLALQQAETDLNLATSLSDQAEIARAERDRLSDEAQTALATAKAAEQAANAAVATQQANLTLLYEQLASLKNTSVYLEQQYRIGLEANASNPGSGGGGGDGGGGGGGGDAGGGFTVPGNEVNNAAAAQHFAMVQLASMGFGSSDGFCLIWLWNRESGWRTNAYNASSGAYGIPQSLPGSKMANYAADWRTNYETQVMWGLLYIMGRYGSPCAAWSHSESVGWY